MAIILLINFILLNLILINRNNNEGIFKNLLNGILILSVFIVAINEVLSWFNFLNFLTLTSTWFITILIQVYITYRLKINLKETFLELIKKSRSAFKSLNFALKLLAVFLILLVTLIAFQGIIYPPNNWDSMAYHLPRVIEWQNHESFSNFQTHILRQLYQPCFSEYVIFQVNLLNGNDYFANSVQLFYLLGIGVGIICINQTLFKQNFALLSFIFTCCLPQAMLEASSTQNDILHGFFIVASVYFAIESYRKKSYKNFIFLGISVGIALLTKAIAYLYLPIIAFFLGVLLIIEIFKTRRITFIKPAFLTIIIVILINFSHSYRNYSITGDIMGTDKKESADYLNEQFYPKYIASTVVKNIGLHFDPFFVGHLGNKLVEKYHLVTKQNVNLKGSNLFDMKYNAEPGWKNHEDYQPNFVHLIIFTISIFIFFLKSFKQDKFRPILIYSGLIISQFIFFCIIITWEPWNTRLHLPLFCLSIPVSIYALSGLKKLNKQLIIISCSSLLAYGYYLIVFNYSRPFINTSSTTKIKMTDNRFKKYFANQPELYSEYNSCTELIRYDKNIGLIIHNDTWEYPLYTKFLSDQKNPIHINVTNYTRVIENSKTKVDCIISNTINKNTITFHGKIFRNSTKNNKLIWLYR